MAAPAAAPATAAAAPPQAAAADVASTLRTLAARLAHEGHALQAIKCWVAVLQQQSMLPSDEAAARLSLARLLLAHTLNVADAKQHLQKAEMLAAPLPGQQLLKCEVLAALGDAHQLLGEADFQRRCYAKGLEVCKDTGGAAGATSSDTLHEWAGYFHLHTAESLLAAGQAKAAAEQVQAAAALAGRHQMAGLQALCALCQMQLALLSWDKQASDAAAKAAAAQMEQLQQTAAQGGEAQQQQAAAQLVFKVLQVVMAVQAGRFQDLGAGQSKDSPPAVISELQDLLQQLAQAQQQQQQQQQRQQQADDAGEGRDQQPRGLSLARGWLLLPVAGALVQLLAAVILKPLGRNSRALEHISSGLRLLTDHTSQLLQDAAATSDAVGARHAAQQQLRACLALRVLLLEARLQLSILSSDFASARGAAAESIQLLLRFPALLADARPAVHLQAGLYAQAVGAMDAALAHFNRMAALAAECKADHLAVDGCCLAAMCCLAQDDPSSLSRARQYLGGLAAEGDAELGYPGRCLAHVSSSLLSLFRPDMTAEERGDAKTRLGKALKMAHQQLQNHQVVSQVLLFMAPLQVAVGDLGGARSMIVSSTTLSKGAGDLHTQVAGVSMLQQLLEEMRDGSTAAQNANYVARKREQLSAAIQAAESDGAQHALVLTWGLQ